MSIIGSAFGKTLKNLRKKTGKTQEEVAAEAGITYRYLQKLESGAQTPHYLNLFKIAETLNTTPDKIIGKVYRQWVEDGRADDLQRKG